MDVKNLLPLGTIVILKGTSKKVMIIGVCPQSKNDAGETVANDYIGVMYPEGYISADMFMVFDRDNIEQVIQKGYSGDGEWSEFLRVVDVALLAQGNA